MNQTQNPEPGDHGAPSSPPPEIGREKTYTEIYRDEVPAHCVEVHNFGRHAKGIYLVAAEAVKRASVLKDSQLENFSSGLADALEQRDAARALLFNPDENANERFERIGEMYYRDTLRLRPGKDEPMGSGRDSNDPENVKAFGTWYDDKCRKAHGVKL